MYSNLINILQKSKQTSIFQLKKFEKISESDFSWTIGLCSSGLFGTCFWRFEIQILRNLNMLVLNASRLNASFPQQKLQKKVVLVPHLGSQTHVSRKLTERRPETFA